MKKREEYQTKIGTGPLAEHYKNPNCVWQTYGRRCRMLGVTSAGGGDTAVYYCPWHWRVLRGTPNDVALFSEFVVARSKTQPESIWVTETDVCWEKVQGYDPAEKPKTRKPVTHHDDELPDPVLAKRVTKLITSRMDHKITMAAYCTELDLLETAYPGIGFKQSAETLRREYPNVPKT